MLLSGAVEPIAGFLGALLVSRLQPILPFGLAFAVGAMYLCGRGRIDSTITIKRSWSNPSINDWLYFRFYNYNDGCCFRIRNKK